MMGIGILTAGLILAVMIIPFIASVMRDVFEIVPAVLKESAYGLGCTTWEVVRKIVLPYTKTGVVGGVMLGPGPRARRNHGRHVRDRQRAAACPGRCLRPATVSPRPWPTNLPKPPRPCTCLRCLRWRLILFVITFIVLSAAKLMLVGMSRKEGVK